MTSCARPRFAGQLAPRRRGARRRGHRLVRLLRAVPAASSHVPAHRPRDRLAARTHRGHACGRRRPGHRRRQRSGDDGRVPGVPGLRDRVPERGALRPHDRGGAGPDRGDPPHPRARGPRPRAQARPAAPLGHLRRGYGAGARPGTPARPARIRGDQGGQPAGVIAPARPPAAARAGYGPDRGPAVRVRDGRGLPRRPARHDAGPWRAPAIARSGHAPAAAAGRWRCTTAIRIPRATDRRASGSPSSRTPR